MAKKKADAEKKFSLIEATRNVLGTFPVGETINLEQIVKRLLKKTPPEIGMRRFETAQAAGQARIEREKPGHVVKSPRPEKTDEEKQRMGLVYLLHDVLSNLQRLGEISYVPLTDEKGKERKAYLRNSPPYIRQPGTAPRREKKAKAPRATRAAKAPRAARAAKPKAERKPRAAKAKGANGNGNVADPNKKAIARKARKTKGKGIEPNPMEQVENAGAEA